MKEFFIYNEQPSLRFVGIVMFRISYFNGYAQPESIVLRDLKWDASAPAGFGELVIPSEGSDGSQVRKSLQEAINSFNSVQ